MHAVFASVIVYIYIYTLHEMAYIKWSDVARVNS